MCENLIKQFERQIFHLIRSSTRLLLSLSLTMNQQLIHSHPSFFFFFAADLLLQLMNLMKVLPTWPLTNTRSTQKWQFSLLNTTNGSYFNLRLVHTNKSYVARIRRNPLSILSFLSLSPLKENVMIELIVLCAFYHSAKI